MFFRLLKLAGLDLEAKLAELKADVAFKAQQLSEQVTNKARTMAIVAGLLVAAAFMVLLAFVVGLVALYKWGELRYGVFGGLALDGAVLIALAVILAVVALWMSERSEKLTLTDATGGWRRPRPLAEATDYAPTPDSARSPAAMPRAQNLRVQEFRSQVMDPKDLVDPMLVLLGGYLRPPHTGHAAIDDMLRQMGPRAATMTNEAVARSAELVRHGSRPTMLGVLGAAALFGWLVVHRPAQH
jgi:hypothetical protein